MNNRLTNVLLAVIAVLLAVNLVIGLSTSSRRNAKPTSTQTRIIAGDLWSTTSGETELDGLLTKANREGWRFREMRWGPDGYSRYAVVVLEK